MTKEKTPIQDLLFELDEISGGIGCRVIVLNDIQDLLSNLRISMDYLNPAELHIRIREMHRTVRVLDELTQAAVVPLNEESEKLRYLSECLIEEARGECEEVKSK